MQTAVSDRYSQLSQETDVLIASPLGLVILVYDRTIDCLVSSRRAIETGNDPKQDIDRAFRLIHQGLLSVLDFKAGEVAHNLSSLYRWALRQLLMVRVSQDLERLNAVIDSLVVVRSGWQGLLDLPQTSFELEKSSRQPA